LVGLTEEQLAVAGLGEGVARRRLLGDLTYRSARLKEELAECGVLSVSGPTGGQESGSK